MCSGRVDPVFILKAFMQGIDGVMVLGCHFGDCHYINGNYNAEKRILALKHLLSFTPVSPERLCLDWVSAAEGDRFATMVNDFITRIREMGPIENPRQTRTVFEAINDVLSGELFRHLTGIQYQVTEDHNVYGERISEEKYDAILKEGIFKEFVRCRVVRILGEKAMTVPEISSVMGIAPEIIFNETCALMEKGMVNLMDTKDEYPRYKSS
jgi:coenzyme F420-reducing hydrogenase delta subunit